MVVGYKGVWVVSGFEQMERGEGERDCKKNLSSPSLSSSRKKKLHSAVKTTFFSTLYFLFFLLITMNETTLFFIKYAISVK
jgi:hypothetical protein